MLIALSVTGHAGEGFDAIHVFVITYTCIIIIYFWQVCWFLPTGAFLTVHENCQSTLQLNSHIAEVHNGMCTFNVQCKFIISMSCPSITTSNSLLLLKSPHNKTELFSRERERREDTCVLLLRVPLFCRVLFSCVHLNYNTKSSHIRTSHRHLYEM